MLRRIHIRIEQKNGSLVALSFPNTLIGLPAEAARRQGIQSGTNMVLDARLKRAGMTAFFSCFV